MQIENELFCDDIRFEQNNKTSLMGLYGDRILITPRPGVEIKWPIRLRLSCYLRFKFEETDERPDNFIFNFSINGKELPAISGEIKADLRKTIANLAMSAEGLPLELGFVGYSVQLKLGEKELFSERRENGLAIEIASS